MIVILKPPVEKTLRKHPNHIYSLSIVVLPQYLAPHILEYIFFAFAAMQEYPAASHSFV
jgi:hypothetical protein